jgi:hypothetical protein
MQRSGNGMGRAVLGVSCFPSLRHGLRVSFSSVADSSANFGRMEEKRVFSGSRTNVAAAVGPLTVSANQAAQFVRIRSSGDAFDSRRCRGSFRSLFFMSQPSWPCRRDGISYVPECEHTGRLRLPKASGIPGMRVGLYRRSPSSQLGWRSVGLSPYWLMT